MQGLSDPRFQTEVALFNLEANLGPRSLQGRFLRELEADLSGVVEIARDAAHALGIEVLLTGILPTLRREDLAEKNLTPEARYRALNDSSLVAHGGAIRLLIDGIERFEVQFDSVVVEGANTSLQLHLQVAPEQAARLYNLSQLITAPLLAAAANSSVLLHKRLWHETRVAVFERAFDDRSASQVSRGVPTRVGFGSFWLRNSLVELFRDNIARYQVIMTRSSLEDPMEMLERGGVPELAALALHNGTVWRWNRPCYGITDGKPHLRIESRVLPGGPTVLDEVANAALFYGMMIALDEEYGDVGQRLPFSEARTNFLSAARSGLSSRFRWLDGRSVDARELLTGELIPAAREGLFQVGVPGEDVERYLGVIEARVETGQTGAQWLLDTVSSVPEESRAEHCAAAAQAMLDYQRSNTPVHAWKPAARSSLGGEAGPRTLADIMTVDVFTVRPDAVIDLATSVMDWKHVRHVPVEDHQGKVVGLLTARELLGLREGSGGAALAVKDVMNTSPPTAPPDLGVSDGLRRLMSSETGCLLIVSEGLLAGIVTERDFLERLVDDNSQSGP